MGSVSFAPAQHWYFLSTVPSVAFIDNISTLPAKCFSMDGILSAPIWKTNNRYTGEYCSLGSSEVSKPCEIVILALHLGPGAFFTYLQTPLNRRSKACYT